jgi:hypothetical protein
VNRKLTLVCVLGVSTLAMAQTTPAPPDASAPATSSSPGNTKPKAEGSAQSQQMMAIPATLAKSIDSKKVKAGDEIDAKLSVSLTGPSGMKIPEGSKIIGHITEAKSKAKGDSASSLTFAFEKLVVKNGQEMPLKAVAQAIGMPANVAAAAFPESGGPNSQPSGAGVGSSRSAASGAAGAGRSGSPASDPSSSAGGEPGSSGTAGNGRLPDNATGVVGMKGLTLNSEANAAVVSSDSKSVKLDEGTQLLLRVLPQ